MFAAHVLLLLLSSICYPSLQRCEEKELDFRYTDPSGGVNALTILELHDKVSSCSLQRKGDRVTITLHKASEFPWYELAKKK